MYGKIILSISIQADPAKFEVLIRKLYSEQKLKGNNNSKHKMSNSLQAKFRPENVINE